MFVYTEIVVTLVSDLKPIIHQYEKILVIAIAVTSVLAISSCAKDRIKGCIDPFSINYNPNATDEDGSCFAPSSQRHALMGDFTATWCPYCGQWGGPEFDEAIQLSGSNAIALSIHNTDELTVSESTTLTDYYGAEGIVGGFQHYMFGTNLHFLTELQAQVLLLQKLQLTG